MSRWSSAGSSRGLRGNLCDIELHKSSASWHSCDSVFGQDGLPSITNGETSAGRGPVRMADVWLGRDCELWTVYKSSRPLQRLTNVHTTVDHTLLYTCTHEKLHNYWGVRVVKALIFPQTSPPSSHTSSTSCYLYLNHCCPSRGKSSGNKSAM